MSKRAEVLVAMNMSIDGIGKAGVAEELTLPKLATKTEEFRGAGMNAAIDIAMGVEKLESSWSVQEYVKTNFELFGAFRNKAKNIVFRGSVDDGSKEKAVKVTMRGTVKEVDMGTWKSGDKAPIKYAATLEYYKLEIDNEEVIEIDIMNTVFKVNGVDLLEERRKNLGI